MKEFSLYSNANSQAFSYYVVLPGAAAPGERYPVLLLLHGAFEHHTVWKDRAKAVLLELAARHRLIIILPDGEPFGWYSDSRQPGRQANQIETFLIKELMPDAAQRVPEADFRRVGIGGISMGGHGAFTLTMRNPGMFHCVSSMSGILDITRHSKSWELPDVFGPIAANRTVWEAHSAYMLAEKNPEILKRLPLLISVSTGDAAAIRENRDFHRLLNNHGIQHEFFESPGRHDWAYWLQELPRHIAFHGINLNNMPVN